MTVMQPYGYYSPPSGDEGTGTLYGNQPQLPEVRHHITYGIQTASRPNEDRVPWEAFLSALNARRSVAPSDPHNPYTIYRVVLTYLGIDEEELDAILIDIEDPNYIYEWYTEGIQIGTPSANPLVSGVSHAFNFVVKQIYPEPQSNDRRWPALLQGTTVGASFGPSPTKISGSGVIYKSTPSEIGAQVAWEPENFEGKVWLYGVDLTITPGVGGSATKGRIVIYGNRSNIRPLSGASDGWVIAAGFAIGAGTSSTIGSMTFRPQGQTDTPIPLIQYEDITRWREEGMPQHFEVGKSALTPNGWNVLKRMVAEYRVGMEGWHSYIELSGFASPTYTSEFNMRLSQNRAQSVFNAMYQLLGSAMKTPSHQTTIRGYGMEPALLMGHLEHGEENADSRRVEIRLNGVLVAQILGS